MQQTRRSSPPRFPNIRLPLYFAPGRVADSLRAEGNARYEACQHAYDRGTGPNVRGVANASVVSCSVTSSPDGLVPVGRLQEARPPLSPSSTLVVQQWISTTELISTMYQYL